MRKRILVAHSVDATRSIAEAVLRQNGYDVIAVPSADRAKEVIQFARPDLIMVGADLMGAGDRPFYEKIQNDPRTASVPLLIFEPTEPMDLPFPQEVIIPQPFDPRELIQRVMTFSGQSDARRSAPSANPLSAMPVDDDFLDAALGLDRIDVTDSEVMDRTNINRKLASPEKPVGFGHDEKDPLNESAKVESLMIREERSEIERKAPPVKPQAAPASPTGTSKLEIMNDQYGLNDPDAFKVQHKEDQVHDYDWFVKSMQDESKGGGPRQPAAPSTPPGESQKLNISTTAAMVNPITPGPGAPPVVTETRSMPAGKNRSAGVEKFIDEFKKEIEALRSNEPESIFVEDGQKHHGNESSLLWEETLEKISPQQMELFTRQLAQEIAEKIAEKIISRIDSDKLLQLIKSEIVTHLKSRSV
jgi:CheY-like chemotaxis protein